MRQRIKVTFPATTKHNPSVDTATAQQIAKICPASVLDVGCGDGFYGSVVRQIFPYTYLAGIDSNPKWVEHCRELGTVYDEVIEGDLSSYDFGSYDLVIFGDVLEHLEKSVAMESLKRCLQTSKFVIVNGPVGFQPQDHEDWQEIHRCGIERSDFDGLNVVQYTETEPGVMMNCLIKGAP